MKGIFWFSIAALILLAQAHKGVSEEVSSPIAPAYSQVQSR